MNLEQFLRDVTKQNSNQFSSLISPVVISDNFTDDSSYCSNDSLASIDEKQTTIRTHTEKAAFNFSLKFSNSQTKTPHTHSIQPQHQFHLLQSNFDTKKCSVTQTKICCAIETYCHCHPQPALKSYLRFWQVPIDENDYLVTNLVALAGVYQWIIFRQNTHPAQPVLPTDRPPTTNEFISGHFLKLMVINFVYVDALPGTPNVLLLLFY
ncbi:unnamed protein product [Rotaria magnacalcarata]|uniref:Uncharacterized protein n=1 Tax=Rotaria magnacalcarata TaxID=392030 RepID=A0A816UMM8_9BILA|nr:unnamed protein product [Rotaria magnacalcarata]CAF2116188.1 unnamed protein product [Rotaria magnacalcarata]